jgi:Sec-independent protein secretion pathway component TatC
MKGSAVWIIVAHVIAWAMAAPVVAGLLTPSPDFITMSLIWLAIGGVFEVVFLMYWFLIRRKP